jgi:drug/metabolite transporter (DMT)-like permease
VNVWLALFLTTLSWAAVFHAGKYVVGIVPPGSAAIWRLVIAALFMVPLVTLREGWNRLELSQDTIVRLLLCGVCISAFQLAMYYGLRDSSATNASLIMALSPALTVLLVALIERRNMGTVRWLGLAIGIVGVIVVITSGSWTALVALSFGRGDVWLTGAALSWAAYAVILRRPLHGVTMLQFSTCNIGICALMTILAVTATSSVPLQLPSVAAWPPLLFMGIVGSGLAYLGWNSAVTRIGAARAVPFMNLIPVFTMAIGAGLGEAVTGVQLGGAALVIGGVALATRGDESPGQVRKKQAA